MAALNRDENLLRSESRVPVSQVGRLRPRVPRSTWSVSGGREPRWMLHPWAMLPPPWKGSHPSSHPGMCSVTPVSRSPPAVLCRVWVQVVVTRCLSHPSGICLCGHHTEGPSCERCLPGFYGNPFTGQADDCQPCPCPGQSACTTIPDSGEVVCTHCPPSQRGECPGTLPLPKPQE